MSTFILTWNPAISNVKLKDFIEGMKKFDFNGEAVSGWAIWDYDKLAVGDHVFLLRIGKGRTGIVQYGHVCDWEEKERNWKGELKKSHYVYYTPDVFINSEKADTITIEMLEKAIPTFNWRDGRSGRILSPKEEEKLEELWNDFLEENSDIFEDPEKGRSEEYEFWKEWEEEHGDEDWDEDDWEDNEVENENIKQ